MSFGLARSLRRTGLVLAVTAAGCSIGKVEEPTAPPPRRPSLADQLKPYVPATRPADPVTDALPQNPLDAQPSVPLRYSVELWEVLMPRGSVSADEAFWKRVDEPTTPEAQQLIKNGVRAGELPLTELDAFLKTIEDRGGKRTTYNGLAGRQVEIPVRKNVTEQIVFYHDRDDNLVGRTWERCDDLFYFSFETTPRNPDRVRIAFTPAVRSNEKRLTYAVAPGKPDREIRTVVEQSNYDVTIGADLRLDRLLIIAPSPAARATTTIGGTFLIESTPAEQQERVVLVRPHAFTQADAASN